MPKSPEYQPSSEESQKTEETMTDMKKGPIEKMPQADKSSKTGGDKGSKRLTYEELAERLQTESGKEVSVLRRDQNVEDIDISKWYLIYFEDNEFDVPLKFVSIKRRGPDYYADTEIWKDADGNRYEVGRTDYARKHLKKLPSIQEMQELLEKEARE